MRYSRQWLLTRLTLCGNMLGWYTGAVYDDARVDARGFHVAQIGAVFLDRYNIAQVVNANGGQRTIAYCDTAAEFIAWTSGAMHAAAQMSNAQTERTKAGDCHCFDGRPKC